MSGTINRIRSPWTRAIAGLLAPSVTASLVAGLLAAGVPAAHAQDAAAAAATSANQSSPRGAGAPLDASKAGAAPQGGSSTGGQTGSAPAGGAVQQPGGDPSVTGQSDKPPVVCFKLTGRCVEQKKGSATKGGASAAQAGSTAKRPLNLAAPDVRTVVPAEELKEPLPTNDQITEVQESETVQVKTDNGVPPDVPGGFGALWWAVNHPSQAWRILAPAE